MNVFSANQAKTHFGDMLLKVQREPIQINKNGKPVAVIISNEEYNNIEALKLQLLKARVNQMNSEIESGELVDGELFFDLLAKGQYD